MLLYKLYVKCMVSLDLHSAYFSKYGINIYFEILQCHKTYLFWYSFITLITDIHFIVGSSHLTS